jgi:hypothetical protein
MKQKTEGSRMATGKTGVQNHQIGKPDRKTMGPRVCEQLPASLGDELLVTISEIGEVAFWGDPMEGEAISGMLGTSLFPPTRYCG